ncbi:MAG: DNA mismatch repair protein MutS [Chloroflexia bacterium]
MDTPLRHQYLRIKRRYPDAILLFRLGDFYESFDDDARIVSQVCDIVLTSRPVAKDRRVPMAGVPYHAVETYVARLLAAGYKVAVCDQLSEPGRGLVERDVVRVITPGTVVEPTILPAGRNNYIAAVLVEGEQAGLAYADVSTGEFATTELRDEEALLEVQRELSRLQPAELLLPETPAAAAFGNAGGVAVTRYPAWHWQEETARQALKDYFGVERLEGFGCEGKPLAVRAAGALLQYLQDTQQNLLCQIRALRTYSTGHYMTLDPQTRRNLELTANTLTGEATYSLLWVLDQTRTPMGARLLRRWLNQPLLDIAAINARLDAVELFVRDTALRTAVRDLLSGMRDIERTTSRILSGIAGPRELLGLRASLEKVPTLRSLLAPVLQERPDSVLALPDPCTEVAELIGRAISEEAPATLSAGGVIRPGFSAELDQIVSASREAREWIASLEEKERRRTGIRTLKVGYNKVFGYYIEVTRALEKMVPPEYIRKQTLVNAERYITPELKEYEAIVLGAQERMAEIEARLYKEVLLQIAAVADRLLATADVLARLDVCAALAEVAVRNRYVRPVLNEGEALDIRAGRHPVVELTLKDEPFIPNDIHLDCNDAQLIVLTGPNMSGKSTFLRQVALTVLMAQMGSFVPADSAEIGLVDRIFTRVGAQDDIATGRSTFMVEMTETANILHHATRRSLIVLDEIGRGTSTYDGLAIARAVLEYIHNHPRLGARTIFATHYHELTEMAQVLPRVRNFNVAVSEEGGKVVFLRKIVPGGADRSYGIHVAQLAGLPGSVIHRAEEVLAQLERTRQKEERREVLRQVTVVKQLPLFGPGPSRVVEELKRLRVEELTPLEAINKLYELKRMVEEENS